MNNNKQSFALDFHETTKYNKNRSDYELVTEYKIYPNTKSFLLDEFRLEASDFVNSILTRVSTRDFEDTPLAFEKLSNLLHLASSIRPKNEKSLRTNPSAGARYPLEIYLSINNCDKLKSGLYHYNILEGTLELLKQGDFTEDIYLATPQDFIRNAQCTLLISGVFSRTMSKYGERGYRYVLFDAGHLGQNIYLASTYLGLGAVAIGGFDDNELNKLCSIYSKDESILYAFAIGNPKIKKEEV